MAKRSTSLHPLLTNIISIIIIIVLTSLTPQASSKQHFITEPSNVIVNETGTIVLKCVVGDLGGEIQWAKDGFGLGSGVGQIHGYNGRYVVTGVNDKRTLTISTAKLMDDGEFECQVTPKAASNHTALVAKAYVHVQVAPQFVNINDYANEATVAFKHKGNWLNLTCVSGPSKPAATIVWYKNNKTITGSQKSSVSSKDKLLINSTTLGFKPTEHDNQAIYRCEAFNNASKTVSHSSIKLDYHYPPDRIVIEGYKSRTVLNEGSSVHLKCTAFNGNPPPLVYWYKNDAIYDMNYTTGKGEAVNDVYVTVYAADNNAIFKCSGENNEEKTGLKQEVQFVVHYGPGEPVITGRDYAKRGENVTLKCMTRPSNPVATIVWEINGEKREGISQTHADGVTTSEIDVLLNPIRTSSIACICRATNEVTTKSTAKYLAVLSPPDKPIIRDYKNPISAHTVFRMTCQVTGGNPRPLVQWYRKVNDCKGGSEIKPIEPAKDLDRFHQNMVEVTIQLTTSKDENNVIYYCNATNNATDDPVSTHVKLNVTYAPLALRAYTIPASPRAGELTSLVCESDETNPAYTLHWMKDQIQMKSHQPVVIVTKCNGFTASTMMNITLQAADDKQKYRCVASNYALSDKTAGQGLKLNIKYRPIFSAKASGPHNVIEFESSVLNFTANGNPSNIIYTWYKGKERLNHNVSTRKRRDVSMEHFVIEGPLLNVTNVTRQDGGLYTVQATNEEGSTNVTFTLDVRYPAEITKVIHNTNVSQNTQGVLKCEFTGNPMPTNISWTRAGYNMSRTVSKKDGTLTVDNVTKEDSGIFVCSVDNGIKDRATEEVKLVVMYKPSIDKSTDFSKYAAGKGTTGFVTCKAEGAPYVNFTWFRKNELVDLSNSHYNQETEKATIISYTSKLTMVNVSYDDYGSYDCKAVNDLGTDSHVIHFADESKPDAPLDPVVHKVTHNAVTLSWKPGFNGGAPQHFLIEYRRKGTEEKITEKVVGTGNIYTIHTGDARGTEYEFAVMGQNKFGIGAMSKYVTARTTDYPTKHGDNVPLIVILTVAIFGMLLFGLNILLILFFYRRRRRKLEKEASEGASNANTVEMFSAPTITEDSKSYSTCDRSLEDFHDDYRIYDPDDELKRFLPPYSTFYRPPSSNLYGPPPHVGSAPHLGPVPFGPSPAFDNQRPTAPQPWDNRKNDVYGSMPRVPTSNPADDHVEYANQLRALQQGITGTLPRDIAHRPRPPRDSQGPASLPPPSRPPPPLPPARSSSHLPDGAPSSLPPLPSRNYDRDEMPHGAALTPRYAPPPGNIDRVSPRPVEPPRPPAPSNLRGQLV